MLSWKDKHGRRSYDDSHGPISNFIKLVKQYPVLYKAKYAKKRESRNANICSVRSSAWEVIAKEVNQTPDECRKRWRSIRDTYVRTKKRGGYRPFRDILSFLDEELNLTANKSIDIKTSEEKNNKILVTLDMVQSLVKDKSDDEDNDAVVEATSNILSSMFNKSLEETINKFTEPNRSAQRSSTSQHPDEYPKEVEADQITAECCRRTKVSDIVSLSAKGISSETIDLTEVNTLKRKLQDSNETEIPNSKTSKTEVAEPSKQELDIPSFFKEIGEYVSTRLPLKKQMELRLKVLSLVTVAELELLHGEDQ